MFLRTLLTLTVLSFSLSAQTRYLDKIFTSVDTVKNLKYGTNVNDTGVTQDLYLDVYKPSGDVEINRPLIVLIHGGAFTVGSKNDPNVEFVCVDLAQRGYVTASIQYRLGVSVPNQLNFGKAILRAVQDAKAAVRYLKDNKATYNIDEDRVAVGGFSAGGVTAVHYAYWSANELPDSMSQGVGDIEGETGTPGVSSSIKCILNCWGAISDSTWINSNDSNIPVIAFHGTNDQIVPYDAGFAFGMPTLPLSGSNVVHRQCEANNFISEITLYEGMGHGHSATDPQMDTTLSRTITFFYNNLVGESSIASKSIIPQIKKGLRTVKYVNFNERNTFVEGYKAFSINGRAINPTNINTKKRNANGVVILRKFKN